MSELNWERVETILDRALELPEERRGDFIERECGDDEQLKGEVTLLLESISDSEGWLEEPGKYKRNFYEEVADDMELLSAGRSLVGTEVGSYTIKEKIGEGGMGSVYLAERTDDTFEHRVAIKIIRVGKATEENVSRFRREQRILAGLDHPGIARLFDGGVTGEGFPYIIMEYVDGIPIDEYCQKRNCSVQEKNSLFKKVLEAVRHAHENLVIHRDLKPGNILVDEMGNIKILDFGISKLLEEESQNNTLTRTGSRLLTPRYAAPEQIRQQPVTTAADMYALGIVFYQLLADKHPFDLDNLSRFETEQTILEMNPPKPSDRTSEADIRKLLRGDLDAIVLKAIRKEPEERYRGANEFLDDLNRYRDGIPVTAREDSLKYRTNKFFKRHRQGTSVVAGVLLLIISLTGIYTWRITHERNQAQLEAEKAEQVKNLLLDIFNSTNPEYLKYSGEDVPARQLLVAGVDKMENELTNQPEIYIELLGSIGDALQNIDAFDPAEEALKKALKQSNEYYGARSPQTAKILGDLAVMKNSARKPVEAEKFITKAINILEHTGSNTLNLANKYSIYGFSKAIQSQYDSAKYLLKKADSLYIASDNKKSVHRYTNLDNLAEVQIRLGQYDLAEQNLKEVLQFYQSYYSKSHYNIAETRSVLGNLYYRIGQYDKANKLYQKALDMQIDLIGKEHSTVARTYGKLALNYRVKGELGKAKNYANEALAIQRKIHGEKNLSYTKTLNNLALIQLNAEKYKKAKSAFERTIKIKESILHKNHTSLAVAYYNYGIALKEMGDLNTAKAYLKKAIEIDKKKYGPNHQGVAIDLNKLASVFRELGNRQKADSLFTEARNIYLEKLPENHYRIAENLVEHGKLNLQRGEYKLAKKKLTGALKIYKANFDTNDERIKNADSLLAMCEQRILQN